MPIYKTNEKKDGQNKYRVRINYQDAQGNAKQLTRIAYGLSEAKELERHLLRELKDEGPVFKITFQELFDEYTKAKKHEVRESTYEKSKRILKAHVLPHLKDVRLDKLTVQILQSWKLEIEKLGLMLSTRQNIYKEFRTMLNYAVKMEYLPRNPLVKLGNFKGEYAQINKVNFYTVDEFKLFIAQALGHAQTRGYFDYYVFFAIAFYTGMRKGEIHALRWTDIQDEFISVSKSINQKSKGGDKETPPKNKSSIRTLQLPVPLISILNEHRERCSAKYNDFADSYFICGGTRSLRDTSVENMNKKYAKAAKIKKIRIHDFRHSHASVLINSGINILEISRRLGHAKIEETLNTYSHLYPKEEERAVEILNKIT